MRRTERTNLVSRVGAFVVCALLLAAAYGVAPSRASAHRDFCFPLVGRFTSNAAPPEECTSPVGLCTIGALTGSLRGGYAFTMQTLVPSGDPTVPAIHFFTGQSRIETSRGALLTGTDTGTIDLDPSRDGRFVTIITITDGTGRLAGARGQLQLRGQLDLATGGASGDYQGELCVGR